MVRLSDVFLPKYATRRDRMLSVLLFLPAIVALVWMPSLTESVSPMLVWTTYVAAATIFDLKYLRLRRNQ